MLQITEIGSSSVSWLSEVNAREVKTKDTLKLAFDSALVSATYRKRSLVAPYGTPLKIGDLSFLIAAKPPADSATFLVVPRETAIAKVASVRVEPRLETDMADLSLTGTDPVFVQRGLNAMTLALEAMSASSDQESARARRKFLDEQIRRTDSTLEVRRAELAAFRSTSQTFDAGQRVSQEQANLATLRTRREELAADRQVFTSLLAGAIAARKAGDPSKLRSLASAPGVSNSTVIPELYSQLQKLTLVRDSLTRGPFSAAATNPDLQRLDSQIESVADEFIAAARSIVNTFDARIAALDGLAARTAQEVSSLPSTQAEQERLLQDEQSTMRLADQLHDEQQRARISEVAQGGKIEVIDLANSPGSEIRRSSSRKLFLGGLLGFGLAAILIFLIEELNTSLRSKSDVEQLLSLPTLGSIPSLGRTPARGARGLLGRVSPRNRSNGEAAHSMTTSPVFESYRAIRTSLIFSNAVEALRSIAVTSSSPGDGKSTTVANLAIAFAQQDIRILVIDCDLRRGSLHRIFEVPRVPGFTNAIAGGSDLESLIRQPAYPNLFVLTTGVQPPNPGELLGSQRVRELLLEAQEKFDLILIDTPPVLAAADASILASMVDGVVLLVRVGTTTRSAARTAQERLSLVGARILGTVLNDPKEMLESTEEYYYYDYASPNA
jgi:capsular exopolysaccharide synthesis family protein